jgi:hypothetical protein
VGRAGPGAEYGGDAGIDIVSEIGRKDGVGCLSAPRDQLVEERVRWDAAVFDFFFVAKNIMISRLKSALAEHRYGPDLN